MLPEGAPSASAVRGEGTLDTGYSAFITGCPADRAELPRPDLPLVVGLDGGYVHSSPQVAAGLSVSRYTVKTQAVAVYRTLGVASRAAAVHRARTLGLLPEPPPGDRWTRP